MIMAGIWINNIISRFYNVGHAVVNIIFWHICVISNQREWNQWIIRSQFSHLFVVYSNVASDINLPTSKTIARAMYKTVYSACNFFILLYSILFYNLCGFNPTTSPRWWWLMSDHVTAHVSQNHASLCAEKRE